MSSRVSDQILHCFKAKNLDSDEIVQYYVKFLPLNRIDEALSLMISDYIPDELLSASIDLLNKPKAVAAYVKMLKGTAENQKLTIACFREGHDDIVAVNFLCVVNKADLKPGFVHEEKAWEIYYGLVVDEAISADVCGKYGVDSYLSAYGMCVSRRYRNRGIATEMLKARGSVLNLIGLKVTATIFTVHGTQKAALNAGWEDVHVRSYVDINKQYPDFDFSKIIVENSKIMAWPKLSL